jgi:hypothetical protein
LGPALRRLVLFGPLYLVVLGPLYLVVGLAIFFASTF